MRPAEGDPGDEMLMDATEAWRLQQLIGMGFTVRVADELARLDIDLHRIEDLITDGCPHRLARRIMLPV